MCIICTHVRCKHNSNNKNLLLQRDYTFMKFSTLRNDEYYTLVMNENTFQNIYRNNVVGSRKKTFTMKYIRDPGSNPNSFHLPNSFFPRLTHNDGVKFFVTLTRFSRQEKIDETTKLSLPKLWEKKI